MRFKKLSVNCMYLGIVLLMVVALTVNVEGNYFLMLSFGWFAFPEQHLRVRGQYSFIPQKKT